MLGGRNLALLDCVRTPDSVLLVLQAGEDVYLLTRSVAREALPTAAHHAVPCPLAFPWHTHIFFHLN